MSEYMLVRIQAIQDELESFKKLIINQSQNSSNKTNIKGLWKDFSIADEDLEEAKKAMFKDAMEWNQ